MLNNKSDIFIDATILLLKSKKSNNSVILEIVKQILNQHEEDMSKENASDDPVIRIFNDLVIQLVKIKNGSSDESLLEKKSLVLKFLNDPKIKEDTFLSSTMRKLLDDKFDDIDYDTTNLERRLKHGIIYSKINKINRKMMFHLSTCATTADLDKQEEALNELGKLGGSIQTVLVNNELSNTKAVETINFKSKESLKNAITKYGSKKSQVLKTGLQGLNRMLGSNGGFALGETCMIYALTHHFKSGLMMTIARGFVKYNTPNFDGKLGEPLILFITLENVANKNLIQMYKQAYEQTYEKSSKGLSDEEIIDFVHDFFSKGGYTFMMERWDGSNFGIDELTNRIDDLKAQGYHIVAVLLDYMQLMKQENNKLASHTNLSNLTYRLCSKFKNEETLFITPHALEGEAAKLANSGIQNIVKRFGQHNVSGSKEIARHVDLELFIHLEKNDRGNKFLTIQRGKHRSTEDDTPDAHKYCAYPFTKFGCIRDDINGKPAFVTDIYGDDADVIDVTEESNNISSPKKEKSLVSQLFDDEF